MENKIREARKAAGLTQQKMSDILGIPKRTIENWDSGQRKPATWAIKLIIEELERIAKIKAKTKTKDIV